MNQFINVVAEETANSNAISTPLTKTKTLKKNGLNGGQDQKAGCCS